MNTELIKTVAEIITAAATFAIAGTGIWALIYAAKQLKQSTEAEKVRHLVEFIKEFDSEPMVTWRKRVAELRLGGEPFPDEALRLFDFFETLGLLVRRGYLDDDDVWCSFSYWMFNVYADFREEIEQAQREQEGYYGDFCDLIERLRVIERERDCNDDRPSKDEIKEFWQDEVKTLPGAPMKRHTRKSGKVSSGPNHSK